MKPLLLIYFIFSSFLSFSQPGPVYENLVFEGAGLRGIAYCGVLKHLEERGILKDIKKVGGTSAGAITAMMVALGYKEDEIYALISETPFQKFNDGAYFFVGGINRLNKRFGWYQGNAFNHWLEKRIETKTGNADITFQQLKDVGYKDLYVTATCLNKQKMLIFSAETYPNMKVKDAVRISMSVPIYFEAVFIDSMGTVHEKHKNQSGLDIVVDGGIIGNFPIAMFDSISLDAKGLKHRTANPLTLGVRIDRDEQVKEDSLSRELSPFNIEDFPDFLSAFYVMVLENLNRNQLIDEDWKRTISVSSVSISPKIKRLSLDQKQALMKSGEDGTIRFFNKK